MRWIEVLDNWCWGFGSVTDLSLGVSDTSLILYGITSQHKVGKCAYVYDSVLNHIYCSEGFFGSVTDLSLGVSGIWHRTSQHKLGK